MSSNNKTMSHFAQVPKAEIPRSTFDRSHGVKTTMNAGLLYPVFCDEIVPGDTFNLRDTVVGRLATPLVPFMDNLYVDMHYFFVPMRLVWENWERMCGAQDDPDDSTDFIFPKMKSNNTTGYAIDSIFDHFGIPPLVRSLSHASAPFRAYNLIWNEWYRDQNLQDSVSVLKGDTADPEATYKLLPRGKRKDYFTSALPRPQKGPAVNLPLGTSAPVVTTNETIRVKNPGGFDRGLQFGASSTIVHTGLALNPQAVHFGSTTGLQTDLSEATAATINSLRLAFQIQKMYERDARGGTRYVEILKAHFNVTSPDFRLQRPEYLGGSTKNLNTTQVPQTSSTDATSPQAHMAAYALMADSSKGFTHSFTEHGYVIGLASLRADLNYQQGLNRMWTRETRFDFYWPALSHLGEQAVMNGEIYAQGDDVKDVNGNIIDKLPFGYQERHAEYRYKPNEIHSKFRSADPTTLDMWHLAQDFEELPVLNDEFIVENPPIDRVVAVTDEPQFIVDIHFNLQCTRPMPVYAVPGLVDHF